MRPLALAAAATVLPTLAHAHAGHWGTLAGHDHWIALGALGLAGVVAVAALARGRRRRRKEAEEARQGAGGPDS